MFQAVVITTTHLMLIYLGYKVVSQ